MSGYTHYNENRESENIMEHNHGTVCGAWWTGPVCDDGTPCGYGVYEVDGDDLKWQYKSVGYEPDYQPEIHPRGSLRGKPDAILANVWNWDEKWKIEWQEDGREKGQMTRITARDPQAIALYEDATLPGKLKWVEPSLTDHLFFAVPSKEAKKITVRATDRFGKIYKTEREIKQTGAVLKLHAGLRTVISQLMFFLL